MTDKIQAIERCTNENKKNAQTQIEEFRQESIVPSHDETEEERPKLTRKPTLVYPVTIEEQPECDRHPQCYQ